MGPDEREPEAEEPEPSVRNVNHGLVGRDLYQAGTFTQTINNITAQPDRERLCPSGCAPTPTVFVNHVPALGNLTELAGRPGRSAAAVVALSGLGGVGKTALAGHWTQQHAEELYPDGTLYADLRTQRDRGGSAISAVLGQFLIECGWEDWELPGDLSGRYAKFKAHTVDKRMLVVLDHVDNEIEVAQLRPASADSTLIVTSHHHGEYAADQRPLPLEPLDPDAATRLVSELIGSDRAAAEVDAVAELVRLSGGIPRVIELAVGPVTGRGGFSVADVLTGLREDLRAAQDPSDMESILDVVAERSYRSLPPKAKRLYHGLAWHPGEDVSKGAVLAVAASLGDAGMASLIDLVDHHLLDPLPPNRYRMSSLVKAHARRCARQAGEAETATLRTLAEWYAARAHGADRAMIPNRTRVFFDESTRPADHFADDAAARDWFAAERHNLLAVQRRCHTEGWLDLVMRLAESMWVMYIGGRYLEDWLESSRMAVSAAVDAADGKAEVRFRAYLARVLMELKHWDWAKVELDLAVAAPMAWDIGPDLRASAIEFTGRWHTEQLRYREAIDCYDRARTLFAAQAGRVELPERERAASARGVTLQLQFIGMCLLDLGTPQDLLDALTHLEQAESRMTAVAGHERDVATIRTLRGRALRKSGRVDEAYAAVSMAVDVLAGRRWYRIEVKALLELSKIARLLGQTELERTCLERLRNIYSATDSPRLAEIDELLARLPDA